MPLTIDPVLSQWFKLAAGTGPQTYQGPSNTMAMRMPFLQGAQGYYPNQNYNRFSGFSFTPQGWAAAAPISPYWGQPMHNPDYASAFNAMTQGMGQQLFDAIKQGGGGNGVLSGVEKKPENG